MSSKIAVSLQQDILTLLCWSDDHGSTVAKLIPVNLFEGDFKHIAEKAIDFWRNHNQAPKQHIADLLADILENKEDRRAKTYQRILIQMYEVKDEINVEFVLGSAEQYVRMQRAKATLLEAAEKLDAQGVAGLPEAESLLTSFLRDRTLSLDPGIKLSEIDRILEYFTRIQSEFKTGIKQLDDAGISPIRGKLLLFIASAKSGKTWFLVQLGKMAFLQRKKVLHISLEIEAEEVAQRYYQALFGAAKHDDTNKISTFKFDRKGNLDQVVSQTVDLPFNFDSIAIREELNTRISHYGGRAGNFIIKRFPMRSLTVNQLEAYLESLESIYHFVPDMVIVDYPGIMKTDANNHRITLGRLVEELRGMSQRRNFALCAVHQTNRSGADVELVKATHASEDWSVICTADFAITYSRTAAEKRYGLARLFVDAARSEIDGFGILISQSYKTGQFCLESMRLSDSYAHIMEQMAAEHHDEEEAEE